MFNQVNQYLSHITCQYSYKKKYKVTYRKSTIKNHLLKAVIWGIFKHVKHQFNTHIYYIHKMSTSENELLIAKRYAAFLQQIQHVFEKASFR